MGQQNEEVAPGQSLPALGIQVPAWAHTQHPLTTEQQKEGGALDQRDLALGIQVLTRARTHHPVALLQSQHRHLS